MFVSETSGDRKTESLERRSPLHFFDEDPCYHGFGIQFITLSCVELAIPFGIFTGPEFVIW